LLHFNLADFYYRIIDYILQRILHIASQNCWYSMQINLCWWASAKVHVYLISWFCSNCENLMLAKYTCFTVYSCQCIQKQSQQAKYIRYLIKFVRTKTDILHVTTSHRSWSTPRRIKCIHTMTLNVITYATLHTYVIHV